MSDTLSREAADATVRSALHGFAAAEDLAVLPNDEPLRTALDLDSLDFLTFVERLTLATGKRIDEIDYSNLVTIGTCVEFLTTRV